MNYGLQMYSVRDITGTDLAGALKKVAELGYSFVEFAGFFGNSAEDVKKMLDDISEYDNIFVVGPNWWGIYPMALYTQLEALDFTGKTVHYVVTHEGSGLGGVPKTIKSACKGAKLGSSLAVHGGSAPSSRSQVENWAKKAL